MRAYDILSHDDGVNRWRMARAAPAAALRGHVDHYLDYWEQTSFHTRSELASTRTVLIFNLGEYLEIVDAQGHSVRLGPGEGFVGGFADGTSLSRTTGTGQGVHVMLGWAGLARLCGAPLGLLANRVERIEDVLGGWMRAVGQRLLGAPDMEARFCVLDAALGAALARGRRADARIVAATRALGADPARPIAAIAGALELSQRHFIARFREETGFPPAHYRRLLRFERFTEAIARAPAVRLADLAQDAGYYDEPHLARDVQAFAGLTPGALRGLLIPQGGGFLAD